MKKLKINIVGGGPVGLFLGICLSKAGIDCTIFEKNSAPVTDSRSLGIHPVSMQLFEKLEIEQPFLEKGIQIKTGLAHTGKKLLGKINFSNLEPPFNYILAVPQFYTEQILEQEFLTLNPDGLIRNAEVTRIIQDESKVQLEYKKNDSTDSSTSDYLIGCDGKNSFVRTSASVFYGGKRYPDTYVMGDFEDNTEFGEDAVVYLPKNGMIECFPLPNNMRRWVVKTSDFITKPTNSMIAELVQERTGYDLIDQKSTMLSGFGVQHFTAERFIKNRILLCGDSAHVVSPIGGQGMNLGWIAASKIADAFVQSSSDSELNLQLLEFEKSHRKRVRKAALRAEWNMKLGRKTLFPVLRNGLVRLMLSKPFGKFTAQQFTMKGLE